MQELLASKTGGRKRIVLIPNWVDDVGIAQAPEPRVTTDKTVFQFFGNMGRVQGLDVLLEAIARARAQRAAFSFIGTGACSSLVTEFVKTHPDLGVEYLPGIPFHRNSDGLLACDVAVISLTRGMRG